MPANGGSHKRRNNKTHRFNSLPNSDMTTVSSRYKWWARVAVTALLLSFILLFGISSNTWFAPHNSLNNSQLPPVYTVKIVNEFPHDHDAFTQGLLYWGNDTLYESTGIYGQSTVRKVALQTGKVETQYKMDQTIFGEGLTLLDERLYQVTWLRKTGFIYDRNNFNNVTAFTHHMNDGWGLTTDGKTLFGSDGSSILYQMDPKTMEGCCHNFIKFTCFLIQTDCIVRLSPGGTVVGWILLPNLREALIQEGETNFDVLNGIAWDSDKQRIFVTGKLWPKLYEIKLHPMKGHSRVNIQQLCMPNVHFHF
ncbi:hypothetical protein KSS87_005748 [Heliosperma pusillum]|nr:hypothetical protein KSS87_005748 [Heliosperma pusillum]